MKTPKKDTHAAEVGKSIEQVQQRMKDEAQAWKKLLENLQKLRTGPLGQTKRTTPENKAE
ncbi:MAG: hypothetical protein JST38_02860 [Bacteroidetes bacterium]|nr:hypothetical protein [Bacteroidota bacterium]MBS1939799.1 hypothetical protein [Bacteroidota bacterium]